MKRKLCIYIFTFFSHFVYAQYDTLSNKNFFLLEKLEDKISLDSSFDYNLINTCVMHFSNNHRNKKRISFLSYNKKLEKWAFLHSNEMKKYNFFDHINRKTKFLRDIDDRAIYVGYNNYVELAENLYYGFVDVNNLPTYKELAYTITKAFIDSKHHNMNLLNKNVVEMGGAIVFLDQSKNGFLHYYFTQSFGKKIVN